MSLGGAKKEKQMKPAIRLNNIEEYYFSKKLREVESLNSKDKAIINLGIGSPDLEPHPKVIKTAIDCMWQSQSHKYQSYRGIPELRKAITDFYHKQFRTNLNWENQVLPLMGSKEGIMHISLAFLNKGDGVLVPNPGYPTYSSVTKMLEAEPIYYKLDEINNYQPDFSALEKLNLEQIKLMWVNYPHMPTGANANKETFTRLIDFGRKHNIVIINDNPYSFILNDNPCSILKYANPNNNILELNSLSKTFNMAGWRVGMLVGNPDLLKEVLKVKTQMDSGMFYCVQKGAIAALGLSKDWYANLNNEYRERREYIWEIVDKLGWKVANKEASGLFVWAKLKNGEKSEEVVDRLLYEKSIFVAPGNIFGDNGEGYIRLSLCMPKEVIREALGRLD